MATLLLKNICKEYPNVGKKRKGSKDNGPVLAVDNFNMQINDGEFIVFVGPSGCGKSTTLRMIAGLESITSGELYIDDFLVNAIPPKDRNISMVFQNYALYPHMTVYENICFPLNYTRFNHPIKAREMEVENATNEIEYGKKLLAKIAAGKTVKFSEEDIKAKIANNEIALKEAIERLEQAKIDLAKITPTKEELLEYKMFLKKKPEGYKDNLTYLKCRKFYEATRTKYSKEDKDEIVRKVASMVDVEQYLDRKPRALSGGQRQRVALARALVRSPKVFLLDEPLSNLDAKLRTQMRAEIVSLHNKIKKTFIYVTHDQIEAMTMGDRIVVMKLGKIQQIDTPTNLFDYPNNKFVAGFIGTPQMNFYDVQIKKVASNIEIKFADGNKLTFKLNQLRKLKDQYLDGKEHEVTLGIRSEDLSIDESGLEGVITATEILGNETLVYFDSKLSDKNMILRSYSRPNLTIGNTLHYSMNPSKIHLFEKEGEELSILER